MKRVYHRPEFISRARI